jgi:hypothetical protein
MAKEDPIKEILKKEEKTRLQAEKARMEEAKAALPKRIKKIDVVFTNIEDPPAPNKPSPPLRFNYEGHDYGPLYHGRKYKLPVSVVTHLNSLSVPTYENIVDEVTGETRSVPAGKMPRFNCTPTELYQPEVNHAE